MSDNATSLDTILSSTTSTSFDPALPYTPPAAVNIDPDAGLLYVPPPATITGAVLTVGAGKEYATLSAALAAAPDGATILVDAGTYLNDFGTITSKVTIIGVGGMANFVATEAPTNLKGILTVDDDATIENCSFSGAAISAADGGNAAGIRYEGGALTLIDDSFSNNQDGLLAAAVLPQLTTNTITIKNSAFTDNGSDSGYTHNLYVGAIQSLTVTDSTFEGAVVGHELKSRAEVNTITDNVIADGPTGTASYDIDLPDGGEDVVSGNLIEKGADASNDALIHFGGEGIPYAGSSLTVSDNTLVDDLGTSAVGVLNQTAIVADVSDNAFVGFAGATIADGPVTETGNVDGNGNPLPDTSTTTLATSGSTVIYTDTSAHDLVLTGPITAVEGGAGLLTVQAEIGHVIVIGGSGGLDFSEGPLSGGNEITTAANSTNQLDLTGQDTVASYGTDVISAGSMNVTAQIDGSATITGAAGNDGWTVNGQAVISAVGGSDTISAGADAVVAVSGTLGYLDLQTSGGNESFDIDNGGVEVSASVKGGAASFVAYGGVLSVTTASSGAGSDIALGAGAAQVMSLGADTIQAGSGSDTVIVSGPAQVYAGTGGLSVFGRSDSGGAVIYGDGGVVTLNGDTGNLTFVGGAAAGAVDLLLSRNTIKGGSGHLTINGGLAETEIGGSGGITVNATDGGGGNTITTEAGASDLINLAAADVVHSYGTDTINGGSGNQVIDVHGNASINGSTGNSQITLAGSSDTYVGAGQDWITVEGGGSDTLDLGTAMWVDDLGSTVTLKALGNASVALSGTGTIADSASGLVLTTEAGSSSTATISGGSSSVTLDGTDQLHAIGGAATVNIAAASAAVTGVDATLDIDHTSTADTAVVSISATGGSVLYSQAAGKLSFIGNGTNAYLAAGNGTALVSAGSGNVTLVGGQGILAFVGGTGKDVVEVGAGGGIVDLAGGSTTVVGGTGAPMTLGFLTGENGGYDLVSGFRLGVDKLVLPKNDPVEIAANSKGYLLSLADGTRAQFVGVVPQGQG